ncbi:MAG: septal ring lytic transglycosylase RlpA family protein [Bryobacteraceae bacterium]|jgi:rare lipoprotein A
MRKALLIAMAGTLVLAGCHRKRSAQTPAPPAPAPAAATTLPAPGAPANPEAPAAATPESSEAGLASWYGHPYHGRASASGEIYDMEQMTAAHRTLPFGTMVRVYDLDNEKSVDVRINDRGPFVDGRIIDLSHAAARAIEMIGPGTARVRLEILSAPPPVQAHFGVQVGAFRERENAERLRQAMEAKYGRARLVRRADTPGWWHVVVGMESSQDGASALANRIRGDDSSVTSAFVVRLDSV